MPRVVLDANVLISAAVNREGAPGKIVSEWRRGAFDLAVSPRLLAEVEHALASSKLRGGVPEARGREIVSSLRADALILDDAPATERVVTRDLKDDYLVALARAADAEVIVTGDRHLLEIPDLVPPAVTPRRFLTILEALDRGYV